MWSATLAKASHLNFGKPQLIAGLLLLAFVLQCAWLMAHVPVNSSELQYHASEPARSPLHSPLTSMLATFPAQALRILPDASSALWWISLRATFTVIGALLGAAVWYIARRLYGNNAGYVALALYCFSPAMVAHSSAVTPDIVASFGAFGIVWTAVATAHTLYAPREVVLWNWKRIVLLGVAIALGVGAQFAVALLIALGLGFMFYLAPARKLAALAIIASASAIAFVLLLAIYGFHLREFIGSVTHASWADFSVATIRHAAAWKMVALFFLGNSPGLVLLLVISLVTFATWRHARYFGTSAPLLTTIALIVLLMVMPRAAGFSFLIIMLPFALVFIAGVCADLLETRNIVVRSVSTGIIVAVLITHALFSVVGLQHTSMPRHSGSEAPHAAATADQHRPK